jgi:hypothetical protein
MNFDPYDPVWYLGLAYLAGTLTCFLIICHDVGEAPDDVTPPSIQEVLFMSAMWPIMMPLLAYVQWAEQRKAEKKTP